MSTDVLRTLLKIHWAAFCYYQLLWHSLDSPPPPPKWQVRHYQVSVVVITSVLTAESPGIKPHWSHRYFFHCISLLFICDLCTDNKVEYNLMWPPGC